MFELNSSKMHFIAVYLSEAHAADEWPLGDYVCINQHKTIEERVAAAKSLISKLGFKIPVYVDTIENSFDDTYYAWPDRYYIVQNGVMKKYGSAVYGLGFDRKQFIEDLTKFGGSVPSVQYKPFTSTVPDADHGVKDFISFHEKFAANFQNRDGCLIS